MVLSEIVYCFVIECSDTYNTMDAFIVFELEALISWNFSETKLTVLGRKCRDTRVLNVVGFSFMQPATVVFPV